MDKDDKIPYLRLFIWVNIFEIISITTIIITQVQQNGIIDGFDWVMLTACILCVIVGLALRKRETKILYWAEHWAEEIERRQKKNRSIVESRYYFYSGIAMTGYLALLVFSSPSIRHDPVGLVVFTGWIVVILGEMFKDAREWTRKAESGAEPLDDERLRSIGRKAMVHTFYIVLASLFITYVSASVLAVKGIRIPVESVLGLLLGIAIFSAFFLYNYYARKGTPESRPEVDIL